MKGTRLYEASVLIIIGFVITAIGVTLLSVGVNKHDKEEREKEKRLRHDPPKSTLVAPPRTKPIEKAPEEPKEEPKEEDSSSWWKFWDRP